MANEQENLNKDKFLKYQSRKWDVHIVDSCASAFDVAKQKISEGAENAALVITETQTGGKGRQSRKWLSPRGGIWMSIILKPNLELEKISSITLLCAAAVCQTIEEMFPEIEPSIKWPNDVYIDSKKVCGILTETVLKGKRAEYVIVGIGINANNTTDDFDEDIKGTSISFNEIGIYVDREKMAALINDRLQDMVIRYEETKDLNFILDYYTKHMHWINEEAVMRNTITDNIVNRGILKGIDNSGRLLMEVDGEIIKIISGELSLRRA